MSGRQRSGLTPTERATRYLIGGATYAYLGVTAILALLPFYWMLVLATLSKDQIFAFPPHWLPGRELASNVMELATGLPFARAYTNSIMVASSHTLLLLFFCSLAGYAFAKRSFPGRDVLCASAIGTAFVPGWAGLVPLYIILRKLCLIDTLPGLVVPWMVSAIGIFWMRQAVRQSVPDELLDAARIDGCGEYGMYFRIVLPVVRPALGALAIMAFMGSWNDFVGPLLIISSPSNWTLPLLLRVAIATGSTKPTPWGALMAGTLLSVVPMVVIYVSASRQFIAGLTAGALKF